MSEEFPTLKGKQKTFADLVIGGMEATKAWIQIGYSPKGAKQAAWRCLRYPHVAAYIEREREILAEQTRVKKWQVLEFLSEVITTPIGELDETSTLVQELTTDEIGEEIVRKKLKMVGKIDAIDRMAKMLGWYQPEKEAERPVNVVVNIGGANGA